MSKWVKIYTNFYTHRKTAKLRAAIGDDAFWIPPRLWAYAAENQPDGNFSQYSAQEIANLIGYTKDADKMLQAMLQAGFLDSDPVRIHDWQEHGGIHLVFAERAKNAARARWERAKESNKENSDKNKGRQDKRSIASSSARGPGSPAPANSAAPIPPFKNLYPREYDNLIADAKQQIERLKGQPNNEEAIKQLREKIRAWQSEKLGVKLPVPTPRKPLPANPQPGSTAGLIDIHNLPEAQLAEMRRKLHESVGL